MNTRNPTLQHPLPGTCLKGWRRQFSRPTGALGWAVGHLMAFKNRHRSQWVIALLGPKPADHVLEIGFGSGADIRRVSKIARDGFVAGIDHSEVMVRQAGRRNAAAIQTGRVELKQASMSAIPYPDETFDKVFSINSFQFAPNPMDVLEEMRRVLKAGGLIAIAVRPPARDATAETSHQTGEALVQGLTASGFSQVRVESKRMKPVPAVCAMGIK